MKKIKQLGHLLFFIIFTFFSCNKTKVEPAEKDCTTKNYGMVTVTYSASNTTHTIDYRQVG